MSWDIIAGLFLPLLGFIILIVSHAFMSRRLTGYIACSTILLSFLCFATHLIRHEVDSAPLDLILFHWIPLSAVSVDFSLHVDHLALLMTLIVTGVGFLIHVYSIGYMEEESDFVRYFACLNFFIFAMLLLVLAGNLVLLFVGWEGVGLASYLLIGFWYSKLSAAQAATKAFIINRIGDLGLLLGIVLTLHLFGTADISTLIASSNEKFPVGSSTVTILTLLYFVGAIGKSAQLPLYTWLPDAMEGPTPVSALIHAATMVTAGVYLIVRLYPVFLLAPETLQWIGYIGGITALFAALCALAQTDLKRVLAFSTVSQLGLMFVACSVAGFYAAMFHLTTHAFMKALLFLAAGNVVHSLHGTTEMSKMGGLAKSLPITNAFFLIGILAMSGIPPLAAFFSKDLIIEEVHFAGAHLLYFISLAVSILTAFYLTRAYCLTFLGEKKGETPQDVPSVMWAPVSILALLSILGGFLGYSFGNRSLLESFLAQLRNAFPLESILTSGTLLSVGAAILGLGAAWTLYGRHKEKPLSFPLFFKRGFYINELYATVIILPLKKLSTLIISVVEPRFFNGLINGLIQGTHGAARALQSLQNGQIRSYVAWMSLGFVFLLLYLLKE